MNDSAYMYSKTHALHSFVERSIKKDFPAIESKK